MQDIQGDIGSLKWFPKINKELGKSLSPEELDKVEVSIFDSTYC